MKQAMQCEDLQFNSGGVPVFPGLARRDSGGDDDVSE
jgi:hypothetical protein